MQPKQQRLFDVALEVLRMRSQRDLSSQSKEKSKEREAGSQAWLAGSHLFDQGLTEQTFPDMASTEKDLMVRNTIASSPVVLNKDTFSISAQSNAARSQIKLR